MKGACLLSVFILIAVCSANHVTNVKEIHAIADGPAIDIYVNGLKTRTGIQYGSMSDYIPIPRGQNFVQITRTGVAPGTESLISQSVDLIGGQYVTIAAVGSMTNPDFPFRLFIIQDEIEIPPEQALLRTLYLSATVENIDVLDNQVDATQTLWRNISYPGAGTPDYLLLTPNIPYEIEVQATLGSDANLAGPTLINLPRNTANTLFVIGIVGSRSSPLAIVYSQDFVTGQASPSSSSTRTSTSSPSLSGTPSTTQTPSVTRSVNTTASTTPTLTASRSLSNIVTRSPFRSIFVDDDDGDFTKSTTPIPASPFISRTPFRTVAQAPSATSTPGPLESAPFPSPFLSRTPFTTVDGFSDTEDSTENSDSSESNLLLPLLSTICGLILLAA